MHSSLRKILITSAACAAAALVAIASPWIYAVGAGVLWDRAEREIHLLPAGYVGPVVILLDDSLAPLIEREDGARLFHIPSSGVAHARFPLNEGWGRPDYFYVDQAGRRTRIVSGTPCDRDLPTDPVQACLLGHKAFSTLRDREYEAYVVGRRADQSKWEQRADLFVDSVVYGRRPFMVPSNER